MKDAYTRQVAGVLKVMEESAEEFAVLDGLYMDTAKTFRDETAKIDDATIDRAIAATHKLEISTASLATSTQQ